MLQQNNLYKCIPSVVYTVIHPSAKGICCMQLYACLGLHPAPGYLFSCVVVQAYLNLHGHLQSDQGTN
jgi:hypothetical protein